MLLRHQSVRPPRCASPPAPRRRAARRLRVLLSPLLLLLAHTPIPAAPSSNLPWKCPAGQFGDECTTIRIEANAASLEIHADYVGDYEMVPQSAGAARAVCTGRPVYKFTPPDPSKAKWLAYMHISFWPYKSAWMVFDSDPTLEKVGNPYRNTMTPSDTTYCQSAGYLNPDSQTPPFRREGLTSLFELLEVHLYMQTSDRTPAHRPEGDWLSRTQLALYDVDTGVSSRCIAGCAGCPSGTASRGCDVLTLSALDTPGGFAFPDAARIEGTYVRMGTGVAEHAIYARLNATSAEYDAWINYRWFTNYFDDNGKGVFTEGYCLGYDGYPSNTQPLAACEYLAVVRSNDTQTRAGDPTTPADERLSWVWQGISGPGTVWLRADGLALACEPCTSCRPGFASTVGSAECTGCAAGQFAAANNSDACARCAPGFFQTSTHGSACLACPTGFFSDAEHQGLECEECSAGFFSAVTGMANSCTGCPRGYAQNQPGQKQCTSCPRGKLSSPTGRADGAQARACTECNVGRFSERAGAAKCTACPRGYSQGEGGSASCRRCRAGYISDTGAAKCTECPTHSYILGEGQGGTITVNTRLTSTCLPCPSCSHHPTSPCGTCSREDGFQQLPGFWSISNLSLSEAEMRAAMAAPSSSSSNASSSSSPSTAAAAAAAAAASSIAASEDEGLAALEGRVYLPCDVIGFETVPVDDYSDGTAAASDNSTGSEAQQAAVDTDDEELGLGGLTAARDVTACLVSGDNVHYCSEGYHGFLCAECVDGYGHGSRKSTCQQCDNSAGPWLRMATAMLFAILVVAYIVKRKTRKQSASLERVGLLYMQFSGYALALAVNWPSYVHVFLQVRCHHHRGDVYL